MPKISKLCEKIEYFARGRISFKPVKSIFLLCEILGGFYGRFKRN